MASVLQSSGRQGDGDGDDGDGWVSSVSSVPMPVAVKRVGLRNTSAIAKQQLVAEAVLMAQFDHPNVVRLIGYGSGKASTFLVMELCEEKSLLLYLQKERNARSAEYNTHCRAPQSCRAWCVFCNSGGDNHPLPLARISLETARGMAYLTSLGYVHRDLAARNVLVTRRARAPGLGPGPVPGLAYASTGMDAAGGGDAGHDALGGPGLGKEAGAPHGVVCKIADFGLARQLLEGKRYYRSRYASRAVQFHHGGDQLDFARASARTPHVGPQYV